MENQLPEPKETGSKSKLGSALRTILIGLALVILVLTFAMAFYRKFSGG